MKSVAIINGVNKLNLEMDIAAEITFKTARSGGKGGQNVNKVETMVEGSWNIATSNLFNEEQKTLLLERLVNKITGKGFLLVKSQAERTQLGNKQLVIDKMNLLVKRALIVPKKRKATKPGKAVKEKRLDRKKKLGEIKQTRMRVQL